MPLEEITTDGFQFSLKRLLCFPLFVFSAPSAFDLMPPAIHRTQRDPPEESQAQA
jgi:hypothetical protein